MLAKCLLKKKKKNVQNALKQLSTLSVFNFDFNQLFIWLQISIRSLTSPEIVQGKNQVDLHI